MVSLMDTVQEQHHSSQPSMQDFVENMNNDVIKEVGRQFVVQYYTVMNKCPQHLHRFYRDDSYLVRGGDGPVSGQVNIHDKFMKLGLEDCRAVVLQLDALKSHKNSLVIQVSGEISNAGSEMRRFMQTFVLVAKDAANFYVMNDIFHYQDEVYNDVRPNGEEVHESDSTTLKQDTSVIGSYDNSYQGDVDNVNDMKINGEVEEKSTPATVNVPSSGVIDEGSGAYAQHSQRESEISDTDFRRQEVNGQSDEFESAEKELDSSQSKEDMDVQQEDEDFDSGSISQPQEPSKPEGPRTWASLLGNNRDSGTSAQVNHVIQSRNIAKQSTSSVRSGVNKNSDFAKPVSSDSASTSGEQKSTGRPAPTAGESAAPRPGAMAGQRGVNDSCQVFVGNLPHNITEDELRNFFTKFGQVQDVRINRNQKSTKGNLPDFGFVVFDNPKAVKDAVAQKPLYLNKHRINVEEKKVQKDSGNRNYPSGRGGPGRSSTSANRGGSRF